MKKITYYDEIVKQEYVEIVCDTCYKSLSIGNSIIREIGNPFPVKLIIYDTEYDFCSYNCLLQFILDEIKKEKK